MKWTAIALIAALIVALGCELGQAGTPGAETNLTPAPDVDAGPTPATTSADAGQSSERDALIALYNATDGAN